MKKSYIFLFVLIVSNLLSQTYPKREVRAVWLTTVYGLDWPSAKATSQNGIQQQKNELIQILDNLKLANFNTVIMQVRARGDLIYPSRYEPWATSLTGTLGRDPGYDPLKFAIEETHKRGMEFHAWWNVVKVKDDSTLPPNTNPPHIVLRHPDYVKYYKPNNEWWIDMGKPEARNYLINVVMELVRNYDIDGIHFDYIRYPNPDFPDSDTYALYQSEYPNKEEWRRENINKFVRAVYDSIKRVKPWVKVGSAPIGIYKNICDSNGVYVYSPNCGSCQSGIPVATGWQAYCSIYQDSRRWLAEGKHDYHSPQIYWDIQTNPKYNVLARDWKNNSYGRHIYAGSAAYRMSSNSGDWSVSEILSQIDTSRSIGVEGNTFFRYKSLLLKGLIDSLKNSRYKYPAFIHPMPWLDAVKPNPPVNLIARKISEKVFELVWSNPEPPADNDTVRYYAIYKSETSPVDINNIENLVAIVEGNRISYSIQVDDPNKRYYIVVTAFDKLHNESVPSNEVATIPVAVAEFKETPSKFELYQNYPNPFNIETTIEFDVPFNSWVSLKIYNMLGQEVRTLVDGLTEAGKHKVIWDGKNDSGQVVTSGIYFCRFIAGTFTKSIKIVLVK
ncbi:Por secretion system C-terminal sorting domain-containing protein [Candidatus Kryptobacter tengchongensis]|nr:Por secretion system C-terminal sorting domain-containing protein [Candidatus Kryptobacter tengchongensis]